MASSPRPRLPIVAPPAGHSPEALMNYSWAGTDSESAKPWATGAATLVTT